MTVYRCQWCDRHVQWLHTKFGKRMLFDALTVPAPEAPVEQAWMPGTWPIGTRKRTVMAPITHYSRTKREAVRHVLLLHECPPYRKARQEAGI
ncbi:MAG: hypothetical protein ABWY93_04765 [Mycobacterium sp.]